MKKLLLSKFVLIATLLLLSACTGSQTNDEVPKIVDVEIMIPGKISLNKESELSVKLTQGSDIVDDADEVQFEIWKANSKEDSEMIEAKHEKGGIYSIQKTFKEDGLYYVQTHVTARSLHVMPKKQFIVGTATEEELKELEKNSNKQDAPSDQGGSHHH
ncbi:FixH family protein [Alkalihalobacillus sp. BA299]|uniref:FixH family protein n=1 Tax=Alkalihalobacillus sp. BA299 TaxID=2815938 RepID=UPI001ADA2A50|nr:FixH family protein [Alkalihalobacillus sp. BA299]